MDELYKSTLKNLKDSIPQIVKADLVYKTSLKVQEILRGHQFQVDLVEKNYFALDPVREK